MSKKIEWLRRHRDEKLTLVCEADMICEKCPNLMGNKTCKIDANHVTKKDLLLCNRLGLHAGMKYTYRELQLLLQKKMTRQIFEQSCKSCRWYRKGLCSWTNWRAIMTNVSRKIQ